MYIRTYIQLKVSFGNYMYMYLQAYMHVLKIQVHVIMQLLKQCCLLHLIWNISWCASNIYYQASICNVHVLDLDQSLKTGTDIYMYRYVHVGAQI